MSDISFVIEESYRKVGFSIHDDFTVTISSLTAEESQKIRELVVKLAEERKP